MTVRAAASAGPGIIPLKRSLACSFALSLLLHLTLLAIPLSPESSKTETSVSEVSPRLAVKLSAQPAFLVPSESLLPPPSLAKESEPRHSGRSTQTDTDSAIQRPGLELVGYYRSRDLAQMPEPVTPILIPEPPILHLASGTLTMTIFISAAGEIDHIRTDTSELPKIYAEQAINAFREARFWPGKLENGLAVPAMIQIEVKFGIESAE